MTEQEDFETPDFGEADFQDEVFQYLDLLRESGVTNMFGAASYVAEQFGLDRATARDYLGEWMRTFSERHPKTQ